MLEVGVIYLVWVPAGLEAVCRFLASYHNNPGGMPHDLIIVYKGYSRQEELAPFEALLCDVPHQPLYMATAKQDIDAYFAAAAILPHSYVCCLNTSSVLHDPAWLSKLYTHASHPAVGVASASGSWESGTRPWEDVTSQLPRRANYRLLRHYASGMVKHCYALSPDIWNLWQHNRRHLPFPNPHVRTNAFLMKREHLLRLKCPPMLVKEDAHLFEHGKHSLTRQLQRMGLQAIVVGRNGCAYAAQEWIYSGTFRSSDQNNLLVADNRTLEYDKADISYREVLMRLSWGTKL